MDHTVLPPGTPREAALFYVRNNIAVLPLHTMVRRPLMTPQGEPPDYHLVCGCSLPSSKCSPGKHPISHLVPRGVLDATLDESKVKAWWGEFPDANIGGALWQSKLADVAPDSVEWWAEFVARGMPDTARFASGGGDGHEHWLYLRGELPRVQINRKDQYDIMTAGYAVMPPSMHKSGNPYRWLDWRPPEPHPLWLPETVAQQLQTHEVSAATVDPAESSEPPIELTVEQLRVWNGDVQADDRSGGLVEMARMLADAGYVDADGIASILAERDASLGWNKYVDRSDANRSRAYRDIAEKYGRRAPTIHLRGHQSNSRPTRPDPTVKNGTTGLDDDLLEAFTIRQERELTPEEVVWIIEGWLGKGMMTELVAKVKLGKTTWALQGLRAFMLGDESFCGQTISKAGKVLYVTEEGRQTFHEALQRYGLWDDLNDEMVIAYDFLMADMPLNVAVNKMLRTAAKHEVDVVVIDTLTTIAGLDDEDNSGRVGSAMREFRRLANAGYAVFVLRHGRKIGGEVGDAGRGSSAISGAVDILLQIDPFKGEDDDSNLRILRARGRMKATPTDPLTLEFDKETERYRLVGAVRSKEERIGAAILEGLEQLEAFDQERGVTSAEVAVKIAKRPQAVRDELKRLVDDGRVRGGNRPTVKGGTPAKIFWLPAIIQIHPDQSSRSADGLARARTRTDSEGVQNTSHPVFEHGGGTTRMTGPDEPKPKREKTPEAVAKAAEQKAARELAKLEAADAAAPKTEYLVVPRDGSLDDVLGKLISGKCGTAVLSLDTETTGLSAKRDRLRTIQISDGTTHVVIDVWAYEGRFPSAIVNEWLEYVAEVRMHTYLFDLAFLQQVGVTIDPAKIYDVRTAAVVLESKEDWTDYRLQGIAKRHLHEHVSKVEQRKGWDATTLRHAKLAYAAEDARVTFAAGSVLASTLATDADVDALWSCLALERNVQAATWWLASAGAPADRGVMAEAVAEQESVMANLHAMLTGEVGGNVNWRSPKQVLPLLQQHGLDVSSTNEGALMDAIGDEAPDPFIRALLDYRSAGACLGLLRNAQNAIQDDGRIYASFNPIGAQTGRTACSEPNLQNLPHHTRAREAIRPPAGRVFVRADYSQLQLVIAAQIAQDQEMLRILNEPDGDIHQRTADAVGCTRQQAKAVNFGFLFGSGAETFQREQRKNGVYMTLEQAHRYRTLFMRTYRGIRQWHRSLGEWGDETAVIDPSGSGRRRAAIFSNNVKANTPVQMVEAHGFKLALSQLYETRHEVPSARLVMMVHDEIIAECDEADVSRCRSWLGGNMAQAMNSILDGVKARVDVKVVRSYADADKDGMHA